MRTTRGIRRVLVVTVVALLAFGGAVVVLADDARKGCVVDAKLDLAYKAELLGETSLERTDHEISITRDGQPLTGAKVCVRVYMVGMEAMGSSDDAAVETAPGIYGMNVTFLMIGNWEGSILVKQAGMDPVAVNLRFPVV